MEQIKQQISDWLNVEQNNLNEIELEDVEFEPFALQEIDKVVSQMLASNSPANQNEERSMLKNDGLPCKGFWVEGTKDLVLYVWVGNQLRAIVLPNDSWMVRNDITIN